MSEMTEEAVTRREHLGWCKTRAREYLDRGDWQNAWESFASDMLKHPETRAHIALHLGMLLLFNGHINDTRRMEEFIEGFN